jgi:hypothetical protein
VNDREPIEQIRDAYRTLGRLLEGIDWDLFDRCACGHLRLEHSKHGLPHLEGQQPCYRRHCKCRDFDGSLMVAPENPLRSREPRRVREMRAA